MNQRKSVQKGWKIFKNDIVKIQMRRKWDVSEEMQMHKEVVDQLRFLKEMCRK